MKRLLLIDTCGVAGSVALAEASMTAGVETRVVAEEKLPGRSASERLVTVVRELLERQGWTLKGLDAMAVARGPGSFTGVRVGLSAVKGFSEASGVPLIAVSRLEVLARMAVGEEATWAVLGAGRGELYCGEYVGPACLREVLMTVEELRASAGGARAVVCEAAVEEMLRGMSLQVVAEPGAGDLLRIGTERLERREFDDAVGLDANYLRRMEQEIQDRAAARTGAPMTERLAGR